MYNHNKAQQSSNRVHISWDILYFTSSIVMAFRQVLMHPSTLSTSLSNSGCRYVAPGELFPYQIQILLNTFDHSWSELLEVTAWTQKGNGPLLESRMSQSSDAYTRHQGPVWISDKMSYRKILWSFEAARLVVCLNHRLALKLDRHIGSAAAEMPVKFQSNRITM